MHMLAGKTTGQWILPREDSGQSLLEMYFARTHTHTQDHVGFH